MRAAKGRRGSCLPGTLGRRGLWAHCASRPQGGSTARPAWSWTRAPTGAEPAPGRLARDRPRESPHPLRTLPAASTRGFSSEPGGEVGKGQGHTGRQEPGSRGRGAPRTPGRAGGAVVRVTVSRSVPSPVPLSPGSSGTAPGGLPFRTPLSVQLSRPGAGGSA